MLTFTGKSCSPLPDTHEIETLLLFAGRTGGKKNEREQKMARGEHLLLSRAPVRVISEQETRVYAVRTILVARTQPDDPKQNESKQLP